MGKKSNKVLRDITRTDYGVPDDVKKLRKELGVSDESRDKNKDRGRSNHSSNTNSYSRSSSGRTYKQRG